MSSELTPKSTTSAAKKTFRDLPDELLELVVGKLRRLTDLVSTSLTCKRLLRIAAPCLYDSITLYLGDGNDGKVASMPKPSNIGLKYIRKVAIDLEACDGLAARRDRQLDSAHFAVRLLLELLPADKLEAFLWRPRDDFQASNYELLLKTQRCPRRIEGIKLDMVPDGFTSFIASRDFTMVDKLCLLLSNNGMLPYCGGLVRKAVNISHLRIDIDCADDLAHLMGLFDSPIETGLIHKSLFGQYLDTSSNDEPPLEKLNPKYLDLWKLNLRFGAEVYAKVLHLCNLSHLDLRSCESVARIIAVLSSPSNLPHNLECLIIKHTDDGFRDGMTALEGFLTLVGKLQKLIINFECADSLPDVASIVHHGATLTTLAIHASSDIDDSPVTEHYYKLVDLSTLADACQRLEQLSIGIAPASVLSDPAKEPRWCQSLAALCRLPFLRTLQMTPCPTVGPLHSLCAEAYANLVQAMATRIFVWHCAVHQTSPLSIVAFGCCGPLSRNTRSISEASGEQLLFMKSWINGVVGSRYSTEKTLGARFVFVRDARYVEACSDILEFPLSVSCFRPPTHEELETRSRGWGDESNAGWGHH